MGKIASKIWSKGLLGEFGVPQMHDEVRPLAYWHREDLIRAYQLFLNNSEPTLDRHTFTDIFGCFHDQAKSDAAFRVLHPKKGKLDGNTVFAVAAATSNQCFISRISLLFSMFDLDNDGTLNMAEFCIAVRSVLAGLQVCFAGAVMPADIELEVAVDDLFKRIDFNKSGFLTLGEFLVHAYRSRDLQEMLSNLPSDDTRVFENAVKFQRFPIYLPGEATTATQTPGSQSSSRPSSAHSAVAHHSSLKSPRSHRPSLAPPDSEHPGGRSPRRRTTSACPHLQPDPSDRGTWCGSVAYAKLTHRKRASSIRPSRVWTPPPDISKAHAWLLWKFFRHLSGGRATAEPEAVQVFLRDPIAVRKELMAIADLAKLQEPWTLAEVRCDTEARDGTLDFAAEVESLSNQFQRVFTDPHLRQRMEADNGPLTVRSFLCQSLPSLNPTHIESCLEWCRGFRALEVLQQLSAIDAAALKEEDLALVFEMLDVDASGDLTISELVDIGQLSKEKAVEIFEKCRRPEGAALTINDLRNYVKSLSLALGSDVKGLLESFAQAGQEKAQ